MDLVEERGGRLFGYEMKWGKTRPRPPGEWKTAYPVEKLPSVGRALWAITGKIYQMNKDMLLR